MLFNGRSAIKINKLPSKTIQSVKWLVAIKKLPDKPWQWFAVTYEEIIGRYSLQDKRQVESKNDIVNKNVVRINYNNKLVVKLNS